MKRRYKVLVLLIIIQLITTIVFNTQVFAIYKSLEEFVKKNGLETMSDNELETKTGQALNKLGDGVSKDSKISSAGSRIEAIDKNSDYSYEEKMEELNKSFLKLKNDQDGNETDAALYFGYRFGEFWVKYKKEAEKAEKAQEEGKTDAQQFDEKYKEYKKLSKEEKKNIHTLTDYQTALRQLYNKLSKKDKTDKRTEQLAEVEAAVADLDNRDIPDTIYNYPSQNSTTSAGSLDDMIGDADKFINSAGEAAISATSLQSFSQTYYNILLTVGIVVAAIVGLILGIKFMMSGAEGKAQIKELLVPYIVGCIVVFGAFAIWKLIVTILSGM